MSKLIVATLIDWKNEITRILLWEEEVAEVGDSKKDIEKENSFLEIVE